jgi:hypothetical protein
VTAEPEAPDFESALATTVLQKAERAAARAAASTPAGNRRSWGTVPPVMRDKLRAGLLAKLRELASDLELVGALIRDYDQPECSRAKHAEEALLQLVDDYEEAVNIASDWRRVVG